MGAGKRTQTFIPYEGAPFTAKQPVGPVNNRNLGKNQLGGVIFGCTNTTYKECVFKQLFGLPGSHMSYIKNIEPGLPLFLFNYSGRKLHGIFEAASPGKMNINAYAWTTDGSEKTQYPAQVQVSIRLQCNPLTEEQFKPVIIDNYYRPYHFYFELDHAQTSKLLSLLSSQPVPPRAVSPQNTDCWTRIFSPRILSQEDKTSEAVDSYYPSHPHISTDLDYYVSEREQMPSAKEEEDLINNKLKQLALHRDLPSVVTKDDVVSDQLVPYKDSEEERNEENPSSDYASVVAQLVQEVIELKAFKEAHIQKLGFMDRKLVEAEAEIGKLKHRCATLESFSKNISIPNADMDPAAGDLELDHESLFLVGGYDGLNWLSTLDSYSPTNNVIKSLKPMSCIRSYSSVVKLNGEIFAFAGGNGFSWYDTVESYNPANDEWTLRPSLSTPKGSLAGCILNSKIFAIGGGNGSECLADVEMLDLEAGRWISTQSMLQKRFALGAVELNGAIYAVGGYDGTGYLSSAERFDPREHSWRKIENMKSKRGCHSMVVLNEKIYAIGGHNSDLMVPSVEIYDPRLCSWVEGEPMNHSRGYSAAVVLNESIYVLGGIITDQSILDTVECYKEGQGWKVTQHNAIGKRAFCSAIVL